MIKRFILFFLLLDNFVVQSLKKLFPHAYRIKGKCKMCGQCCEEILLKMTPRQMNSKFFRDLVVRWLSWLYGFIFIRYDTERYYLVFTCRHRGGQGKCQNYVWRPNICRNYPLVDYFDKPVFLEGCGFSSSAGSSDRNRIKG